MAAAWRVFVAAGIGKMLFGRLCHYGASASCEAVPFQNTG
jgi:hypothetical protein